jgi:uncharacterized protein YycO
MDGIGKESPASIMIRFVTCDDIVSALIRQHTWCDYSHVEFVLDDGATLGAHADRGVAVRPANYDSFTKIDTFVVPMTVEQKFEIMSFANAQIGKAYDMTAIAGIVFHRDWRNKNQWFCSELVAAAFEQALPLLNVPSSVDRITPRDLLLSLRLRATGGLVTPFSGSV